MPNRFPSLALLALPLLSACQSLSPTESGLRDAREDFARGHYAIKVHGWRNYSADALFESRFGVQMDVFAGGCVVNSKEGAYASAYNIESFRLLEDKFGQGFYQQTCRDAEAARVNSQD